MENKRAEKVSAEKKVILVEFMMDHLNFARGKFLGPEGKITSNNLWQILCQRLNSAGPEKNLTQWQRVWKDLKMKTKKKASAVAGSRMKTGGGPQEDNGLTDVDEKILSVISKIAVFGLTGPDELPLDSAEPVPPVAVIPTAAPEPGPSNSKLWVTFAENAEESVQQEIICSEGLELLSPANSLHSTITESSDGETSATPLRKRRKRNYSEKADSAQAADNFIQIGRETIECIKDVKNELKNLSTQVAKISQQNERLIQERINTNEILNRLVRALEGSSYVNNTK